MDVLLPDNWLNAGGLTLNERRLFLERTDWLYAQYRDMVGAEPWGAGRLTIAVVPSTCGGNA